MIPLKAREYISGKIRLSSIPKIMNLEVTNFCNLNCSICVKKNIREQGFLDIHLLEKIIKDNEKEFKGQSIWLHYGGEPLLHPQLSEIIKILKSSGVRTRLSTNATLLTKEKSFELMRAGLDYIVFSVDGNTKETYEKIRRGGVFEEVEANILNFLKIKKDKNFRTETQIQIVKTKTNEQEVKPFIEKWKKTDINYINVKSFSTRAGRVSEINKFGDFAKLEKKIFNRPPCFFPWETLIILWNGDVLACCQDLCGELKLGNLKENNLMEIWNNSKLTDLRKRQLNNDFSMKPCNRCPDWKGYPRNYFHYFLDVLSRWFLKEVFKIEKKDEGIHIIFNRK